MLLETRAVVVGGVRLGARGVGDGAGGGDARRGEGRAEARARAGETPSRRAGTEADGARARAREARGPRWWTRGGSRRRGGRRAARSRGAQRQSTRAPSSSRGGRPRGRRSSLSEDDADARGRRDFAGGLRALEATGARLAMSREASRGSRRGLLRWVAPRDVAMPRTTPRRAHTLERLGPSWPEKFLGGC